VPGDSLLHPEAKVVPWRGDKCPINVGVHLQAKLSLFTYLLTLLVSGKNMEYISVNTLSLYTTMYLLIMSYKFIFLLIFNVL